jgi:hypothetical protein
VWKGDLQTVSEGDRATSGPTSDVGDTRFWTPAKEFDDFALVCCGQPHLNLLTDPEFYGVQLRKGEQIMLMFESANFDEVVFGDPDSFRIDRSPNNHLAFGFGTHSCLGNQLARLELSMMTKRLLQRLPDLRLTDGAEAPLRAANFVTGLESMVFTPTPVTGTPTHWTKTDSKGAGDA